MNDGRPGPRRTAHTSWGDLLIGQTDGQIRAFDAFTPTPSLSILTSWSGNEAAYGDHPGGAGSIRIPTRG